MTLIKEQKSTIKEILTTIAKDTVNEDLLWTRSWTKEEFDERGYKAKIEKIQKDNNLTLDEAIETFITTYYAHEYGEEDFGKYINSLDEVVESYYSAIDSLNLEFNNEFINYTKGSLSKSLKSDPTEYLFEILSDKIIPYNLNLEGLKALMVA